tara:strand:- start:5953 stop:6765 length:813 start_codon:yes stop_codon:yes gene_type:complete
MAISIDDVNNVLNVIEPIYIKFKQELNAHGKNDQIKYFKLKNENLKLQRKNLKLQRKNLKLKRKIVLIKNNKKCFKEKNQQDDGIVLQINEKMCKRKCKSHRCWTNKYSTLNTQIKYEDESITSEEEEEEEEYSEEEAEEQGEEEAEEQAEEQGEEEAEDLQESQVDKEEEVEEQELEDIKEKIIQKSTDESSEILEVRKDDDNKETQTQVKETEDEEDEEEELYEITINNVNYYTTDPHETNGPVYEILDDGDYGNIVGYLKNKKFTPN